MKKISEKSKILIALVSIISVFSFACCVSAQDEPGKIMLNKSATKVYENSSENNLLEGRHAQVNLDVSAIPFNESVTSTGKLDIMFVVDGSGSMEDDANGSSTNDSTKQRINILKTTYESFVESMMVENNTDIQIGFAEFGTTLKDSNAMSSDKVTVKNFSNQFDADGGTNVQAGINKANELLKQGKRDDAKQIVIILTDGVPTFFNVEGKRGTCGNGRNDNVATQNGCPEIRPSDAAKTALDTLKIDNPTADVYTIAFSNESEAGEKLDKINPESPEGEKPIRKNMDAISGEDLAKVFEEIKDQLQNVIGKNTKVTDIIPKEFKLTAESKQKLEDSGVTIEENAETGETTLTWNVGEIKAGEGNNKTLTYIVEAKEDYHGSIYTNKESITGEQLTSATLTTTLNGENPYYKDATDKDTTTEGKQIELDFNAPTVEIPAIAKDKTWDSIYGGETISGNILENDKWSKEVIEDTDNLQETVSATDEIVIPEQEGLELQADGTYKVMKDGKLQGILSVTLTGDDIGKFTFTATEDATIENASFDYYIKTNFTGNFHETDNVISNTATEIIPINKRAKKDLTITKKWIDNNNQDGIRPEKITVILYADGKPIRTQVIEPSDATENTWTYTFKDLYVYKVGLESEKTEIIYTVDEEKVNDYSKEIDETTITNTHTPALYDETGKITVNKIWLDNANQDGIRPETITVTLTGTITIDGTDKVISTRTYELKSSEDWKHTFENLPKYYEGKEITYKVNENDVDGYYKDITDFNISNTHDPELYNKDGKLTVNKTWIDNNNQDGIRPDTLTITLTGTITIDGTDKVISTTTYELKSSEDWTHTFENLPKYYEGKEIIYKVNENDVEGYEKEINGFDITNKHTPELYDETGKITVNKIWDDNNNQDGIRPETITVTLTGTVKVDGTDKVISTRTYELNSKEDWKHTFENLPKFYEGKEITYKVNEEKVDGYEKEVNNFDITNTHTPELYDETGKITVNKTWDDNNNQDGIRPETITVTLTGTVKVDGTDKVISTRTYELKSSEDWKHTFENLPKFYEGKEITYKVNEEKVDGYEKEINGFDITNKHTPALYDETGKITVNKTWDDNNDQDGIRPETLTITLTGIVKVDGTDKVISTSTYELNSKEDWTHTFENLPKYYEGKEITYKVNEEKVDGYEKEINDFDITNTHTPELYNETGKITVNKTWDDNNDQDGIRPETITVTLTGIIIEENKEVVVSTRTYNLNSNESWTHTFENLPKYYEGKEITYKINEKDVEGYEKEINGFDITNKHTPELYDETGKITVNKTWDDNNNQDGIRPEIITVTLTGTVKENGLDKVISTSTYELNSKENWKHTFENLPKYYEGKEITYKVNENDVDGYEKEINDFDITNTHTPELYDETGKITVNKIWDDNNNQDGIRPETITVTLIGTVKENGLDKVISTSTYELNSKENWKHTFENLPKYYEGKEITYKVNEEKVDGYEKEVNNFDITNTHIPELYDETGKITVNKTWDDNNNQDGIRPKAITIILTGKVNDQIVIEKTYELTEKNNWKHTFENLPKYYEGKEITYKVNENDVDGYEKEINGFDITNTHTPELYDETGKITVNKTWDDNNDQDGIRPETLTITLTGTVKVDGTDKVISTSTYELNSKEDWTHTFENLPKYYEGKEITYKVNEKEVIGYEKEINGFDITNKHTPELYDETGKLPVTKVWDDKDNQDGKRPETITITLKGIANKEIVIEKEVTISAEDNWKYTFENLPKYDNGYEIEYIISELPVADYTTTIDKTTITNKYTPEVRSISGEKTWNDNNNQDGIRPETITVVLTGKVDGKVVITETKEITAIDGWKYVFDSLPKKNNGKTIIYTVTEKDIPEGYKAEYGDYNIINTHTPELYDETGKITVNKTWNDNNNQDGIRPETITVTLTGTVKVDGNDKVISTTTYELKSSENWTHTFENLPKYYEGKEITYKVNEKDVEGYEKEINDFDITNKHTPELYDETGKITVNKIWNDSNDQDGIRPETITVTLTGTVKVDGTDKVISTSTYELNSKENWKHTFENLPKYYEGKEITYKVNENDVDGYEKEINGFDITNTHTPELYDETGKITVNKTWDDNNDQDGKRPETITVTLIGTVKENGLDKVISTSTYELNSKEDWTHTFENLPKYYVGQKITYKVNENDVEGYEKEINGFDIINKHIPELYEEDGKLTITKVWDDNNNQDGIRPETITITLKGIVTVDGTDKVISTKTYELTGKGNAWTHTFEKLPKYYEGKEITYKVDESFVKDYEKTIDGTTITNKHTPGLFDETGEIIGTKTWDDNNNQDGVRPETITVNLYANGKKVQTQTVDATTNWTYKFTNLPKYENGKEILYEVKENNVPNYTTTIKDFDITNTHTPDLYNEDGKLTITKVWDDNNDQDGVRPKTIIVTLTGTVTVDGTDKVISTRTYELTGKGNEWTHTFENLPKNYEGKEITYTISEKEVEGYAGVVDNTTITNTHTPIKINIKGEKIWVDNNDEEGLRPTSITVNLFANNKKIKTTTVTKENNWQYEFTDLPKYSNGQEIDYSVEEEPIEHYESSKDENNEFIIINTHNPKELTISGTKTWDDNNDQDGMRPEKITVTLTGRVGTEEVFSETKTVTEETNWQYEFTNLPEYRKGLLVNYTISEDAVKDYSTEINGYDITNIHKPVIFNIAGKKIWNDSDNQDGIRPDFITINLLANGEKVATTTATKDNNWEYSFKDVVKYAAGKEITYTVEEETVDGYTNEINGWEITNTHTPETISFTVSKVWQDENNQDGIRPDKITVRLLADGKELSVTEITEENNWTYKFTDLPKYRDEGILIKYEIIEDAVKGYETTIDNSISIEDNNNTSVIITNEHKVETTDITVNKIWDDSNDEAKKRPDSITVHLYADGKIIKTITITKDMNWTYTFENLPVYKDGKKIFYVIVEEEVENYITFYDGFTITNAFEAIGGVEITPPGTGINKVELKGTSYSFLEMLLLLVLNTTFIIPTIATTRR